jgi:adenine phosphoribosyltransferase
MKRPENLSKPIGELNKFQKELMDVFKAEREYSFPMHPEIFQQIIEEMMRPFKDVPINKVVAAETKGLLFGPIIAYKLKVPFVTIYKGNKIVDRDCVIKKEFTDYSKKTKSIEMIKTTIDKKDKILLVDDWFDSGNTARAAISLIEGFGGKILGCSVIFNQLKQEDEAFFNKYNYHYIIKLEPKTNEY